MSFALPFRAESLRIARIEGVEHGGGNRSGAHAAVASLRDKGIDERAVGTDEDGDIGFTVLFEFDFVILASQRANQVDIVDNPARIVRGDVIENGLRQAVVLRVEIFSDTR